MALEQQDICMQTVYLHTIFQNSQSNALQTSQKLLIDSTGEILAHFKCTNSIINALKYNPVNNPVKIQQYCYIPKRHSITLKNM